MFKKIISRLGFTLRNSLHRLGFAVTRQQRAQRRLAAIKLEPSDIAIDCGANVGKFTEVMARHGATVYAFEPNPSAFEVLQRRFAGIENVHCIPKGVSDCGGSMPLYLHTNSPEDPVEWSTGSSFLAFKGNVETAHPIEVEVIDLVEFVRGLEGRVKLLKLDVEGMEYRILSALIREGIIHDIDHVFAETHDHSVPELRAAADALRAQISEHGIRNVDFDW